MVNRGWLPTEAAETEIAMGRQREPQRVELNAVVRKSEKVFLLFIKNG
jgi:cytochrome oxidase assembly protein ShyY1